MAEIDAEAEVAAHGVGRLVPRKVRQPRKAVGSGVREQIRFEECDGLVRRFEKTTGLGLKREANDTPGPAFEIDQMRHMAEHQVCHGRHGVWAGDAGLEGTRHRADAAIGLIGRQQRRQQARGIIRIGEPGLVLPIRKVDVFLDGNAMKRPVGKGIQREDIEVVGCEKCLQLGDHGRLARRPRTAKPESRRPTPNDSLGATIVFTARRSVRRTFQISAQLSPRWMLVQ